MSCYITRITKTFRDLDTTAKEWKPCEIVDFDLYKGDDGRDYEIPVWDSPVGYTIVHTRFSADSTCHLCGHHPITQICNIRHDDKRLIMIVGNKCVNTFILASSGHTIEDVIKSKRDNFNYKRIAVEYAALKEQLAIARRGHHNALKREPWWLWQAMLKSYHLGAEPTLRKMVNFIKKYKPEIEYAQTFGESHPTTFGRSGAGVCSSGTHLNPPINGPAPKR